MKTIGMAAAIILALFVGITVIGALTVSPEYSEWRLKKSRFEEFCSTALADSALGAERRQTREMCDDFQRRIEAERPR